MMRDLGEEDRGGAAFLLFGTLLNSIAAHAERADREKPIVFSADTSEAVNYETKEATLSGNVIITQGTMMIRADRVKFRTMPEWRDSRCEVAAIGRVSHLGR